MRFGSDWSLLALAEPQALACGPTARAAAPVFAGHRLAPMGLRRAGSKHHRIYGSEHEPLGSEGKDSL